MVAIAYRRRAIPLAWTWIKSNRGHSTSYKQRALLTYVYRLIPPKTSVILIGDAELVKLKCKNCLESGIGIMFCARKAAIWSDKTIERTFSDWIILWKSQVKEFVDHLPIDRKVCLLRKLDGILESR